MNKPVTYATTPAASSGMVTVTIRGVREHLTIKLDRTADIKRVDIESGLWTLVPVYSVRYTIGEGTITELEVTSFTVVSV